MSDTAAQFASFLKQEAIEIIDALREYNADVKIVDIEIDSGFPIYYFKPSVGLRIQTIVDLKSEIMTELGEEVDIFTDLSKSAVGIKVLMPIAVSLRNINYNLSYDDLEEQYLAAAIDLVAAKQTVSSELFRQKFQIGYTLAENIIDKLEEKGIVGPFRGVDPREIYITPDKRIIEPLPNNDGGSNDEIEHQFSPISDETQVPFKPDEYKAESEPLNSIETEQQQNDDPTKVIKLIATIFLGWSGIHKFMDGKYALGVLYLLTFGVFCLGWFLDVLLQIINICTFKPIIKNQSTNLYQPTVNQPPYVIKNNNPIDYMSGIEFEYFIAELLKQRGFYNVRVTEASGDYGVDIVAMKEGHIWAIQCKKYSGSVGVSAVQEVFSGKQFYNCDKAVVITNSTFTQSARNLALKTNVELWDKNILELLLCQ